MEGSLDEKQLGPDSLVLHMWQPNSIQVSPSFCRRSCLDLVLVTISGRDNRRVTCEGFSRTASEICPRELQMEGEMPRAVAKPPEGSNNSIQQRRPGGALYGF